MDRREYLGMVALLEDLLALARAAMQEEAKGAKGDLIHMQNRIQKAIEAYREKANANRT